MKKVGIVMGSDSDLLILQKTMDTLAELGIPYECHIYSAHRTPEEAGAFARNARKNGIGVIIALLINLLLPRERVLRWMEAVRSANH